MDTRPPDPADQPPEDDAPPVPNLEFKATLLVLAMVLLLAGSALYLMYARGAFERTQELVLIADDSEGVNVGTDLSFSGFPIGRVRRIALADDGSVRIIVDVPEGDARWLRTSSVFVLTRSLVGGTSLRAYSGVLDDPPLPAGAERRVLFGDATAEIPQLVSSVRELLANLNTLTAPDAALSESLAEVRTLLQRLNGPGGALGVVLGDDEQARRLVGGLGGVVARADALLARVDGVVARVDGVVASADRQVLGPEGVVRDVQTAVAELQALLADTRASLQQVNGVLDEAQGIAGNVRGATEDLDALRSQVETSLRRVDRLISDVSRRWPFARDTELKLP